MRHVTGRSFAVLLLVATAGAVSGCCCGERARVLVVDRTDERPIPGAVVRPYYDHCQFGYPTGPGDAVRTDENGRAAIKVDEAMSYRGLTVDADGYRQYLPPGWFYSVGTYMGVPAQDGTRILHMDPLTAPAVEAGRTDAAQ